MYEADPNVFAMAFDTQGNKACESDGCGRRGGSVKGGELETGTEAVVLTQ